MPLPELTRHPDPIELRLEEYWHRWERSLEQQWIQRALRPATLDFFGLSCHVIKFLDFFTITLTNLAAAIASLSFFRDHPDCNVIFLFDRQRRSLITYDMDREILYVSYTLSHIYAPHNCQFFTYYVPCTCNKHQQCKSLN
jgi:hypothetical protein